jgi:hypothetical protein
MLFALGSSSCIGYALGVEAAGSLRCLQVACTACALPRAVGAFYVYCVAAVRGLGPNY